jgi:hypothetical protein
MPAVESRAITFINYDAPTRQMHVTFKAGKTYTFYGVPDQIYQAFLAAPSKGRYFSENIKDKYSIA